MRTSPTLPPLCYVFRFIPGGYPRPSKDETENGVGVVSPLCPISGNGHKSQTLLRFPIRGQTMADAQLRVSQHAGTDCQSASGTVTCSRAHVSMSPRQAVYRYALLVIPCKRQREERTLFRAAPGPDCKSRILGLERVQERIPYRIHA